MGAWWSSSIALCLIKVLLVNVYWFEFFWPSFN